MTATVLADSEMVSHESLLLVMVSLFGLAIGSPFLVLLVQSRQSKQTTTRLVETTARVDKKLDDIHMQGNNALTKAMEAELAAVEQALGAIVEAIDMKLSEGVEVLPESFAAQAKLEEQLAALNEAISGRHHSVQQQLHGEETP